MIRNTILGLKRISPEVVEAGLMSGCTKSQLLFKVLIPTARRDILNGVNTVIMQCLAMVVIASMIGVKGLGQPVLKAITNQYFAMGLFNGLAIVALAIIFDRVSQSFGHRIQQHRSGARE